MAALLGGVGTLHLGSGLSGAGGPMVRRLLKPIAVAGAWAVGAVLLLVLEADGSLSVSVLALAGYRVLFILPNVLLADWGDRAGDVAAGLRTWTSGPRAGTSACAGAGASRRRS